MLEIERMGKTNNYAQVHKNMLYNPNISSKAKGIGALIETFSIGLKISKKKMIEKCKEEEKAFDNGIKELEEYGYLFRFQKRGERGRYRTCWYFNSEGVDINHLNDLIIELEDVTLVTESKILEKLLELNGFYIDKNLSDEGSVNGGTDNRVSVNGHPHLYKNSNFRSNIINEKYFMFKDGKVRLHPHFTQTRKEVK